MRAFGGSGVIGTSSLSPWSPGAGTGTGTGTSAPQLGAAEVTFADDAFHVSLYRDADDAAASAAAAAAGTSAGLSDGPGVPGVPGVPSASLPLPRSLLAFPSAELVLEQQVRTLSTPLSKPLSGPLSRPLPHARAAGDHARTSNIPRRTRVTEPFASHTFLPRRRPLRRQEQLEGLRRDVSALQAMVVSLTDQVAQLRVGQVSEQSRTERGRAGQSGARVHTLH